MRHGFLTALTSQLGSPTSGVGMGEATPSQHIELSGTHYNLRHVVARVNTASFWIYSRHLPLVVSGELY